MRAEVRARTLMGKTVLAVLRKLHLGEVSCVFECGFRSEAAGMNYVAAGLILGAEARGGAGEGGG